MHKAEVFKKLALSEKDARLKIRYLALYHFALNENRTQIAKIKSLKKQPYPIQVRLVHILLQTLILEVSLNQS